LVAPILDATVKRDVALPSGEGWYDWWNPSASGVAGDQTLAAVDATDWKKIPLYVAKGAIIPMNVDDDATSLGDLASKGKLTVLVYPSTSSAFKLHDTDEKITTISQSTDTGTTTISISRALVPVLLRVRDDDGFTEVEVGGQTLSELTSQTDFDASTGGFWRDSATRSVWVHVPKSLQNQVVTLD
jgi:alpha-glucosidase (family GH31 glycosyl hydrolase)